MTNEGTKITQVVDNGQVTNFTQVIDKDAGIVEQLYINGRKVLTTDGKSVEEGLHEAKVSVAENKAAIAAMKGVFTEELLTLIGADPTLSLAFTRIEEIKTVLQSDDTDLDSLQEFVNYVKENRTDINKVVNNYVAKAKIYSGLDSTDETLVASAKAAKDLKDLIDSLTLIVEGKMSKVSGVVGNLVSIAENGEVADSGLSPAQIATVADVEALDVSKRLAITEDTIPEDLAVGGLLIQKIPPVEA